MAINSFDINGNLISQEVLDLGNIETAKILKELYDNFYSKRRAILNRIEKFKRTMQKANIIEVHAELMGFTLMNASLDYFKEGYEIINEIRKMIGLEPTKYLVGILDETNPNSPSAYTIDMTEKVFLRGMRSRGDKTGLAKSTQEVEKLLRRKRKKDVSNTLIPFLEVVKNKTVEHKEKINYGYVFEAWGHFNFTNGAMSDERHSAYYNYYKNAFKNNAAWTTGGDVGNKQFKLIRIYIDEDGKKQVSSASITSANTIKDAFTKLEIWIKTEDLSEARIAYELAKEFTQLNLPKNLNKNIEKTLQSLMDELKTNKF